MKNSYRIDEAADYLGVSRRTVERAIKTGELQSFKFRDARRIELQDLEKAKKKEQNDGFRVPNRQ
jgi:excisionase family DNA binding protein